MSMASSTSDRYYTYRFTNIPESICTADLIQLFPETEREQIIGASLAPSLYALNSKPAQVATITFKSQLQRLRGVPPEDDYALKDETSGLIIKVDTHFRGLTPLNTPIGEGPIVDVISVTGLAGRAFGSWQCSEDGTMWLRDLLPRDIGNIRTVVYGYPSRLFKGQSWASLLDFAANLLSDLENYCSARFPSQEQNSQRSKGSRPLILIGHSLGGLIIKQALISAAKNRKPSEHNVFSAVYSVVFFGTPHRGLKTEALENMVHGTPPEELVRDLREDSTLLANLNEAFAGVASNFHIITCFEKLETPTVCKQPDGTWKRNGPTKIMVNHNSACLFTHNETRIPIMANHSRIAKLSDAPGSAYHAIKAEISQHVSRAPEAIERRQHELESSGRLLEIYHLTDFILSVITSDHFGKGALKNGYGEVSGILRQTLSFLDALKSLIREDGVLQDKRLPTRFTRSVNATLLQLRQLLSSYGELALRHNTSYAQIVCDGRSTTEHSVSTSEGQAVSPLLCNSYLFEENELEQLFSQYSQHISRLQVLSSFAMLTTFRYRDFDALRDFQVSETARKTGLQQIANRQLLTRFERTEDPTQLNGRLSDAYPTNPHLGLRVMRLSTIEDSAGTPVAVEYKKYPTVTFDTPTQDGEIHIDEFRRKYLAKAKDTMCKLAILLRNSSFSVAPTSEAIAPPKLHTFPCLGYLDEPENERLAFVFELPRFPEWPNPGSLRTLHKLIDDTSGNGNSLAREKKFAIAYDLASTVMNLHGSGWVHKNIRSQNVVLIPSSTDLDSKLVPYLKGFEHSRPSWAKTDSQNALDLEDNLYRHPERQGIPEVNFRPEHDVYALGVILWEIGLWKTITSRFRPGIEKCRKERRDPPSPEAVRKNLLKIAEEKLPLEMGTRYCKAVVACLKGDFDEANNRERDSVLGLMFQERVIDAMQAGMLL